MTSRTKGGRLLCRPPLLFAYSATPHRYMCARPFVLRDEHRRLPAALIGG